MMAKRYLWLLSWLFSGVVFAQDKAVDWIDMTKKDLRSIYHNLENNSAGDVDPENVSFHNWLDLGYQKALARAEAVTDYAGYYFILKYYINGFHDDHVVLSAYNDKQAQALSTLWPGFTLQYQQGKFLVSSYHYDSTDQPLPPVGSCLQQCDGVKATALMKNNIFPYYGNPELSADWISHAPLLMINHSNPWIDKQNNCCFNVKGAPRCYILKWRAFPGVFSARAVAYPYVAHYGVEPFTQNGVWVKIPSFNAQDAAHRESLKKLIAQAKTWRNNSTIVFDLRGNGGGNSDWGNQLLTELLGKAFFSVLQYNTVHGAFEQWRVSYSNLSFLRNEMLPYLAKSIGKSSSSYRAIDELYRKMRMALRYRKGVVTVGRQHRHFQEKKLPALPFNSKLILVTDGRCGSGCLPFVGMMLGIPAVIHVGQATHADTTYSELRQVMLPSKNFKLGFPIKITQDRKRPYNQPYRPQIEYPGNINDTTALQQWLATVVLQAPA